MRTCPACRASLAAQWILGVELDVCPDCRGVFLDPGDAEGRGWDLATLFGVATSRQTGASTRACAVHGTEMETWRLGEGLHAMEVDRAPCCGGVFLDAGEGKRFADAAERAATMAASAGLTARGDDSAAADGGDGTITTESGAVFAVPPTGASARTPSAAESVRRGAFTTVARTVVASSTTAARRAEPRAYDIRATDQTERGCPRCAAPMRADRRDGLELDLCPSCGATFLDITDYDARDIDTGALFGMGPEAAVERGPSSLSCPRCAEPMTIVDVPTIAGPLEVERARCCGGLFLDGGEQEPFVCAARRAANIAGDRAFATFGEVVGDAAIVKHIAQSGVVTEIMLNTIRDRVDSMILRMVEENRRRGRTR
jgi:Zn-finger nucleic acid-binding protein